MFEKGLNLAEVFMQKSSTLNEKVIQGIKHGFVLLHVPECEGGDADAGLCEGGGRL